MGQVDEDSRSSGPNEATGSSEDSESFRSSTNLKDLLELNGHNNGAGDDHTSSPPSPLGGKPKSLVDMIQKDFPRTPSPVYQKAQAAAAAAAAQQPLSSSGHVRRSSVQNSSPYYQDEPNLQNAMQNLSVSEVILREELVERLRVGFMSVIAHEFIINFTE